MLTAFFLKTLGFLLKSLQIVTFEIFFLVIIGLQKKTTLNKNIKGCFLSYKFVLIKL